MTLSLENFELGGRAALVTGGAGILGREMCRALARAGARVAVIDLDGEGARDVAERVSTETGRKTSWIRSDVSVPGEVEEMAARAERDLGPVRIVVNNAATKTADPAAFFAPFEEYSLETWQAVTRVNLDGMFLVAQAAGKAMLAHGEGGSIIQTASIYGLVGADQRIYEGSEFQGRAINTPAVYAATKAAIVGLTRHLAAYWGGRGIRVNAIAPGGVASGQNEQFRRQYSARVPMGRMAEAHEIASAVVFLASEGASYINGQVLAVDGGLTAW